MELALGWGGVLADGESRAGCQVAGFFGADGAVTTIRPRWAMELALGWGAVLADVRIGTAVQVAGVFGASGTVAAFESLWTVEFTLGDFGMVCTSWNRGADVGELGRAVIL